LSSAGAVGRKADAKAEQNSAYGPLRRP